MNVFDSQGIQECHFQIPRRVDNLIRCCVSRIALSHDIQGVCACLPRVIIGLDSLLFLNLYLLLLWVMMKEEPANDAKN